MQNQTQIKRKKILYQAKYRGTREMDILIGAFIKKYINSTDDKIFQQLQDLIDTNDSELQQFLLTNKSIKSKSPEQLIILQKFKQFAKNYNP